MEEGEDERRGRTGADSNNRRPRWGLCHVCYVFFYKQGLPPASSAAERLPVYKNKYIEKYAPPAGSPTSDADFSPSSFLPFLPFFPNNY